MIKSMSLVINDSDVGKVGYKWVRMIHCHCQFILFAWPGG